MKKMLIAGNWKMNTTYKEAKELALNIVSGLSGLGQLKSKILFCPPFTNIFAVKEAIKGFEIELGAQNCFYELKGAFTGEISPLMLLELGCNYVIIGHSERRTYFGEDDALINRKVLAATRAGLNVILCIGETLEQRKKNETFSVLEYQINTDLDLFPSEHLKRLVIAYEPVWAIGTGISATNEQIEEAHNWIREYLIGKFGSIANDIIILYGGSLSDSNSAEIFSIANVNGGLIGGASLDATKFLNIIKSAEVILSQ